MNDSSPPTGDDLQEACPNCGHVMDVDRNANDGRALGDWGARYSQEARARYHAEATYIAALFLLNAIAIVVLAFHYVSPIVWLGGDATKDLVPPALAFFGGALGGTLFVMKWLYHSVAKQKWNADRLLWRLFTPLLSAGASTAIILLSTAGVLPIFGRTVVSDPFGSLGIAVVLGYFSDRVFSFLEGFARANLSDDQSAAR